jgi:hypothetical protein
MNRKALFYGLAYSVLYILFKLVILLGGYSLTRFGYYYSNVVGVLLIVPFYFVCVKQVRDQNAGGTISGREAMKVCLTIFAIGAILTSVYNYFEYRYSGQQLAIDYYHSGQFLDFLKSQSKIKSTDYDRIISEQVEGAKGAAFRATTGKLFSLVIIGLTGAFAAASMMKRKTLAS